MMVLNVYTQKANRKISLLSFIIGYFSIENAFTVKLYIFSDNC